MWTPLIQRLSACKQYCVLRGKHAAQQFSAAERDLCFPNISPVAAAGLTPWGDSIFRNRYAPVGFNVTIPVFDGFLFKARQNETRLKLEAGHQKLTDVQNRAARDLHIAWLNASTAYRKLHLSAALLDQLQHADLAQKRYRLRLSSIVELSQAQSNETQAEIDQAGARYDYLTELSRLKYEAGRSEALSSDAGAKLTFLADSNRFQGA